MAGNVGAVRKAGAARLGRRWPSVLMAVGVALAVAATTVPLPLEETRPGRVLDLDERVTVAGAHEPSTGGFDALTVARRRVTTWGWARYRLGFATGDLEPTSAPRASQADKRLAFHDAAQTAVAVAEIELGLNVTWAITGERVLPYSVTVDQDGVGGASGGLAIGLAVYDRLSPIDLARGRRIAGTGTLAADGTVGRVGGVAAKARAAAAAGVDVFVAPTSQAGEARAILGSDVEVLGVDTFAEALAELSS